MAKQIERLVSKAALRVVDIDDLKVDPSYQRTVKPRHRRIVADFNPEALGVPLVGERDDGTLWIVDGLQRIAALKKLGKKTVRAEVFASRGPEHEAEVFKLVNLNRTRLTAHETFIALLTAHDPLAWKIKQIVESEGFVLHLVRSSADEDHLPGAHHASMRSKGMAVSCVNTLLGIMTRNRDSAVGPTEERKSAGMGEASIRFALRTVKAAWPEDPLAVRDIVVGGLSAFFIRRTGVVDDDRMVRTLRTTTPQKLLYSSGLGVGSRVSNFVDSLEKVYRKRVRGGDAPAAE